MTGGSDVVVVGGIRTPFVRSWGAFRRVHPVELGRLAVREVIERSEIDPAEIDGVIAGNTLSPADSGNIARVISLKAGVPAQVPAYTVNRNGASGMQCVTDAAYRIRAGHADLVVTAAVESMSSAPLLLRETAEAAWTDAGRARGTFGKLAALTRLRPRDLVPKPSLPLGWTDPVSGLSMGETAERLAREFQIGRDEQDRFALRSHQRAAAAWEEGRMQEEVMPVPLAPRYDRLVDRDDGVRDRRNLEALAKLPPAFDPAFGTVTAGNASQATDGAVALVLASSSFASERRLPVLGTIRSWGYAGCDPARMGLGPVMAAPVALRRAGALGLHRMEKVELNEAFAAQVLACFRAFASEKFCREHLGTDPLGELDPERVNVNGGAIALGHPVGASGARLILTLLREMDRNDHVLGMAALCVGGGQGAAMVLERS